MENSERRRILKIGGMALIGLIGAPKLKSIDELLSNFHKKKTNMSGIAGASIFNPSVAVNVQRLSKDHANTANTAASTGLSLALNPNTNYEFNGVLYWTVSGGASYNFQVHALASATLVICHPEASFAAANLGTTSTGTNALATQSSNAAVMFAGLITSGTATDTLQIDDINPAAAGTATTKAGSFLELTPVNF